MILSGKEIQRHMGKDIVIQPFDPKRLARGRAGQVANAALGRRGFLRAANWKARAWVGWRQVKVLPAFSKAAGCRAEPYGLPGVRGRSHRLPLLPKKGDECPLLARPRAPRPGRVEKSGLAKGKKPACPARPRASLLYKDFEG